MEKIDVMLVAADEKSLESVAKNLNTDAINLGGALTDIPKKKSFPVGKEKITAYPFLSIASVAANFKNFFNFFNRAGGREVSTSFRPRK